MKVVHVSPMYFGEESVVGGAERYAVELARAMAEQVETEFVSFGPARRSLSLGKLRVEIYPSWLLHGQKDSPVSLRFLPSLARADVIHCHQPSVSSAISLLTGKLLRKPRFLTPLGQAAYRSVHGLIRLGGPTALLCISQYSADHAWYRVPRHVIYGGVDTTRFRPGLDPKERKIVCVARLVPHKGINYLIEAVETDMRLELYGRPYDERYYADLRRLARGKDVHFFTDASDEQVARAYSSALVSVLPSVYVDMYGREWADPELLGLVLLEAMASGTAVIGTSVGAVPEYVHEGVTGFVVPPNDPGSLRAALTALYENPDLAARLGQNGCELVREQFTWEVVAGNCLRAYHSHVS